MNILLARIAVGGLALLASVQVVRIAVASASMEQRPTIAERAWAGHPQVDLALAMTEIGQAAAAGKTVPAATLRRVDRASIHAPLAAQPFLIEGALAKTEGREEQAERLFVAARNRDPRSAAARYFLAERYLATGRARQGLDEVSVLARLVPGGSQLLVPGLVQYARTPGSVPYLRKMFSANPQIGEAVLFELAAHAANAGVIIKIADPKRTGADGAPAPAWQARLLNSLIEQGNFVQAQGLWGRISGIRPSMPPGLVNKDFAQIDAPPPFNWAFGSGSFGFAEPAGGMLKVIYYGRENADLASQLLLLRPGQYQIRMDASGDAGEASALEWSLTCVPGKAKIASIALKDASASATALGGKFTVPRQACAAQWLKLTGTAKEFAKSEQVTIRDLNLSPVGGR